MRVVPTPPPLKSTFPGVDIPGFFDLIGTWLTEYAKAVGYPGNYTPIYAQAFPRERLKNQDSPFDVITYRVRKSTMAPTDNSGQRKPREATLREVLPLKTKTGYARRVSAWWELIDVEFSIWSRDNLNADRTTNWFHQFMMTYLGPVQLRILEANGIQIFRFLERLDDDVDHTQEQEVYRRRLVYEFRLEFQNAVEERLLTALTLNVGPQNTTEVTTLYVDPLNALAPPRTF